MKQLTLSSVFLGVIIFTICFLTLDAALVTFSGRTSTDLSLSTSFISNLPPSTQDDILIPSGTKATVNSQFVCNSLRILSNSTLIITGGTLQFTSGITIESGATIIAQNGATILTQQASTISAPIAGVTAPSVTFPTISVIGQLILYPNTTITAKVDSKSLNVAPPLVMLVMGGGKVQVVPYPPSASTNGLTNDQISTQLQNSPTLIQNTRVVVFDSGSFIYGIDASTNIFKTIQPLKFEFVLFNINTNGSLVVYAQQNGALISTPDSTSTTIRPQQITVDGGEVTIICDNTAEKSTLMDGADIVSSHIELYADISMKNGATMRTITVNSINQSITSATITRTDSTTTTTETTTTKPFIKSKASFFGIVTVDDASMVQINSHTIVEFHSQQCSFDASPSSTTTSTAPKILSSLLLLPASTLRIYSGLSTLSNISYQQPQVNPAGSSWPVFIKPRLEIYATVHFTQPLTLTCDVYLHQNGFLAIGTNIYTTPLDVTLTVLSNFYWYGGTIASLGTSSSETRPIRSLLISTVGKLFVTDEFQSLLSSTYPLSKSDNLANRDASGRVSKTLRHTILQLNDASSVMMNSNLLIQDGSKIIATDSSIIEIQPYANFTTDRVLLDPSTQSSTYLNLLQQFNSNPDSIDMSQSNTIVDFITRENSTVKFMSLQPTSTVISATNSNSALTSKPAFSWTTNTNAQFNIVPLFKRVTIQLPVYNNSATFTRPFAFFTISPFSTPTTPIKMGSITSTTLYNFILDNSINNSLNNNIILQAIPSTLSHPYVGLTLNSVGSIGGFQSSNSLILPTSTTTSSTTSQSPAWTLHSLTLLSSQITIPANSLLTCYGVIQFGSVSSQRSVLYGSGNINTNYLYLYDGDLTAQSLNVTSGFYSIIPTQVPVTSAMLTKVVNIPSIILPQNSFSIFGSAITMLFPASLNLSLSGVLSAGIGSRLDIIGNTSSSSSSSPNNALITINPTGQLYFDNVQSKVASIPSTTTVVNIPVLNNGVIMTNDKIDVQFTQNLISRDVTTSFSAVPSSSTTSPTSSSSSSTSSTANRSSVSISTSPSRSVNTMQVSPSSTPSSSSSSSPSVPQSNIILGKNAQLTLIPSSTQSTTSPTTTNSIQRILGPDSKLVAHDSTQLQDVNVGHITIIQQNDPTTTNNNPTQTSPSTTIFQNGCFAKTSSSYTIFSQPLPGTSPTSTSSSSNSSVLDPINTNSTPNPTTSSNTSPVPTGTQDPNPISTVGPPHVTTCPTPSKPRNTNDIILKWIFLALFILFFIISVILAITLFVIRRNYEKRLRELQSIANKDAKRRLSGATPLPNSTNLEIDPTTASTAISTASMASKTPPTTSPRDPQNCHNKLNAIHEDDVLSPGAKPKTSHPSKPNSQQPPPIQSRRSSSSTTGGNNRNPQPQSHQQSRPPSQQLQQPQNPPKHKSPFAPQR